MHSSGADDFDEYDPTPYDGGYNLVHTFGRPLPPDDEICYPIDSSSSSSSYGGSSSAFKYGSSSSPSPYQYDATADQGSDYQTSQYGSTAYPTSGGGRHGSDEDQGSGYGGYRPKPKPSYGEDQGSGYGGYQPKPNPSYGEEEESGYGGYRPKPKPASDFQPVAEEGFGEYGRQPKPKPAYGYGEEANQEEGFGDYGRPKPKPAYGFRPESGFGRRSEEESYGYEAPPPPPPQVGAGYGFEQQEQGFGYGMPKPERSEYASEQGGRWPPPRSHEEEGVEGYGGGRRPFESGGGLGYGRSEERPSYGEYGGKPSHYREEEGEYRKPSYSRADQEEEGYNRHKYGHNDDDDDGGEKKHHHRHHHNRRHDDD